MEEPARSIIDIKLVALKAEVLSDPSFMAAWLPPAEAVQLDAPDNQGPHQQLTAGCLRTCCSNDQRLIKSKR